MNKGKVFEGEFRSSCEQSGVFILRLNDSSLSWQHERVSKFALENPCDFIVYSKPYLYGVECKSTKFNSMTIQRTKDDDVNSMIKFHQVQSLTKFSNQGVVAGLILNFRNDEDITDNITYWLNIVDFNRFLVENDKKSINKLDCVQYGAIVLEQKLKRTHYTYNIEKLLNDIHVKNKDILDKQEPNSKDIYW